MPELPEVETIKRGLTRKIIGKQIDHIKVSWPKSFLGDPKQALGAKVIKVSRRGKLLEIDLDNQTSLLNHLKMTGQLVYQSENEKDKVIGGHPQASYNQPLTHSHTHVVISFKDESKLYFNDLRKFGYMKLVETNRVKEEPFIKKLGIDALSNKFDSIYLMESLKSRQNSTIYQAILDQHVVAGIGNIYANEALYCAAILPSRKNKDLKISDINKLIKEIKRVLLLSIKYGGSSDSTYRDAEGNIGTYLNFAVVYHKKLDPKKHAIHRTKIAGRSAFYCSFCQK